MNAHERAGPRHPCLIETCDNVIHVPHLLCPDHRPIIAPEEHRALRAAHRDLTRRPVAYEAIVSRTRAAVADHETPGRGS